MPVVISDSIRHLFCNHAWSQNSGFPDLRICVVCGVRETWDRVKGWVRK